MIMKHILAAGFACLICLSVPLSAQSSLEETLTLADKQFELYAYNLAIKSYNEALTTHPQNAHALSQLGRSYLQIGQATKAVEYFEKAIALPGIAEDLPFQFGQALMMTGDYAKARVWFNTYADYKPDVARHFVDVAQWAANNQGTQSDYEVKTELLNTPHSDFLPAFYGDKIVYGSTRNDIVHKTKTGHSDQNWAGGANPQLFASSFDAKSGYLQKPNLLKGELQPSFNEGPVAFTLDGKRVAFCRNNFINGNRHVAESGMNLSLYTADIVGGAWMNVRAFPHNGSDFGTGFPCFSPDGKTLYFSSNRPGTGQGGWDIYSSDWNGSNWSSPANLGADINTPGNEISPYLDENQFYFASDWLAGFGGLDVFTCNLDRGSFTGLKNMGKPVNSASDDYGFVYQAKRSKGFFTSSRPGGKGLEDIYAVSRKMTDYLLTVTTLDGKPISGANIDMTACGKSIYTTAADGKFRFARSNQDAACIATVTHPNYEKMQFEVSNRANDLLVKLAEPPKPVMASVPVVKPPVEQPKPTKTEVAAVSKTDTPVTPAVQPVTHSIPTSGKASAKEALSEPVAVPTIPTETFNGWAVQLIALPDNTDEKNLTSYNNLGAHGNVYVKNVDGKKRIRVGVYETEAIARKKAEELKKQYKTAYPVEEKNMDTALRFTPEAASEMVAEAPKPVMASTSTSQAEAVKKTKPNSPSAKTEPPAKQGMTAKGIEEAELIIMRYAVQLAAFTNDGDAINMSKYMPISDLGGVYTVPEKEFTKVRIGVWEDPAKAESVKAEVIKRGFKEAVVVNEKSTKMTDKLLVRSDVSVPAKIEPEPVKPTTHSAPTTKTNSKSPAVKLPVATTTTKPAPEVKSVPAPVVETKTKYLVRVAAHQDVKTFDDMYIAGIPATKEVRKSGKYNVVYLTGFDTLEGAVDARKTLAKRGLKDAYVVKEEGAKLTRVQF
jgi:tetratricopeptide (TPR) repeat protein